MSSLTIGKNKHTIATVETNRKRLLSSSGAKASKNRSFSLNENVFRFCFAYIVYTKAYQSPGTPQIEYK